MRARRHDPYSRDLQLAFSSGVVDSAIASAAVEIARDTTNGVAPRTLALLLLVDFASGYDGPSYGELVAPRDGDICPGNPIFPTAPRRASNIPVNAIESYKLAIARFEFDPRETHAVRGAANCVMNTWRMLHNFPQQPIMTLTTFPVKIEWLCQQLFRLANSGPEFMKVRVGQHGDPAPTEYWVPSATTDGPGKIEFGLEGVSPAVDLWFDDRIVDSVRVGRTPCP